MPAWAILLIQALPAILQAIIVLVEDIQKGGGTPTPAQAANMLALWDLHDAMTSALRPFMASPRVPLDG